jgi:hypothetical protein
MALNSLSNRCNNLEIANVIFHRSTHAIQFFDHYHTLRTSCSYRYLHKHPLARTGTCLVCRHFSGIDSENAPISYIPSPLANDLRCPSVDWTVHPRTTSLSYKQAENHFCTPHFNCPVVGTWGGSCAPDNPPWEMKSTRCNCWMVPSGGPWYRLSDCLGELDSVRPWTPAIRR